MGIVVVTNVFCDACLNLGNYSSGDQSEKTAALAGALASGWKKVVVGGHVELHCPSCIGTEPDYWKPWFKGSRGCICV